MLSEEPLVTVADEEVGSSGTEGEGDLADCVCAVDETVETAVCSYCQLPVVRERETTEEYKRRCTHLSTSFSLNSSHNLSHGTTTPGAELIASTTASLTFLPVPSLSASSIAARMVEKRVSWGIG